MPNQTWTFHYDADCGMCAAAVRCLRRFDTRDRVTWTPIQSLDTPPRGLTHADLERSAYLVPAPPATTTKASTPSENSCSNSPYSPR